VAGNPENNELEKGYMNKKRQKERDGQGRLKWCKGLAG
jgi:hypothetical protein